MHVCTDAGGEGGKMAGCFNKDDAMINTLPCVLVLRLQEVAGRFNRDDAIINTLPCMLVLMLQRVVEK